MNDKDKNSNEELSFIALITKFFKRKKINFIRVKKKKKKNQFVVSKLPDKDVKEKSIKDNVVNENIDNKEIIRKKQINESITSKKSEETKKEKLEKKETKETKKEKSENSVKNIKKRNKEESEDNVQIFDCDDSAKASDFYNSLEEKKERILEKIIISSFENYLKEKRYLVNNYLALCDEYSDELENSLLYAEAQESSLKIDILMEKVTTLKNELYSLEKYIKLEGDLDIDDAYISHLLDEYKKEFNKNFDVNNLENVSQANKYRPIMIRLNEIDQVVSKLSIEVKDKKAKYDNRDKDFDKLKEKFFESDKNFEKIKLMVKENELLLNDLEYKVANSKRIVNYVEKIYKRVNNNLDVLLFSYLSIKNNPLVPKTVKFAAATSLVLESISCLFNSNIEYRSHSKIVIDDYEREIIDGLKSVDDIFSLIDNTMVSVVDMRKEFERKFREYDLPEYRDILDKLDELSKNLGERREYLKYTKEEFSSELEKNRVKVKEMDYIPYNDEVNEVEDLK